ncbi:MAG: hypothetical protein ACPH3N_13685, partial [Alcanivorax sediminis]|uniref:hypothetical protein n=1 Tax=Alcanivorax sediminis TaxID=2663008 RepID=UPI003C38877B
PFETRDSQLASHPSLSLGTPAGRLLKKASQHLGAEMPLGISAVRPPANIMLAAHTLQATTTQARALFTINYSLILLWLPSHSIPFLLCLQPQKNTMQSFLAVKDSGLKSVPLWLPSQKG